MPSLAEIWRRGSFAASARGVWIGMRCAMRSGYRIRINRMIAGQVTEIFGHGPWHSDRNVSTALLTIGHIGELSWKESNPQALSAPATCHGYTSCPNWV